MQRKHVGRFRATTIDNPHLFEAQQNLEKSFQQEVLREEPSMLAQDMSLIQCSPPLQHCYGYARHTSAQHRFSHMTQALHDNPDLVEAQQNLEKSFKQELMGQEP